MANPRAPWGALPAAERAAFIHGIGAAVGGLTEAGIELLGFAFNDGDTAHRAEYAMRVPRRAGQQRDVVSIGERLRHPRRDGVTAATVLR